MKQKELFGAPIFFIHNYGRVKYRASNERGENSIRKNRGFLSYFF